MPNEPEDDHEPSVIPALFATIHHKSDHRPDGYTDEEIAQLNHLANPPQGASRRIKRGLIAGGGLALLAILVGGAAWISPTWTPGRIVQAVEIGDRSKLEQLINFPALQTSLKADIQDMMKANYRKEIASTSDPMAMLFSGFGDSIVESYGASIVEQIVTPSSLEKAVRGEDIQFSLLGETRNALPEFRHVREGVPGFTAKGRYLSLSRYEYRLRSLESDRSFDVQMRRTGFFSWQIDRVRLDPSFLESPREFDSKTSQIETATASSAGPEDAAISTDQAEMLDWAAGPSVIGLNPAFVESRLGIAKEKGNSYWVFEVGGCTISYKISDNAIVSIEMSVSSQCKPLVEGLRITPNTKFSDVMPGPESVVASCIRSCGNAYDPTIDVYRRGYRANGFIETLFVSNYGSAQSDATEAWQRAIRVDHGIAGDDYENENSDWFQCVSQPPPAVMTLLGPETIGYVKIGRGLNRNGSCQFDSP